MSSCAMVYVRVWLASARSKQNPKQSRALLLDYFVFSARRLHLSYYSMGYYSLIFISFLFYAFILHITGRKIKVEGKL